MKTILKLIGLLLLMVIVAAGGLLVWLSAGEYKPAPTEALEVIPANTTDTGQLQTLDEKDVRVLIWNIGYGALGDNADFFMDGGESVMTADEVRVNENLQAFAEFLNTQDADVIMLQEVDRDSKRSHRIDETLQIRDALEHSYQATFANNYLVPYVPFPMPPIGKVDSGLLTLSRYNIDGATRISLPCPFSWPVRTANLKRCLMVDRIPVSGSDKELVLINLHLEAYDSGEGKIAQTEALLGVLNEERAKGNYVIAGGDFNQRFDNIDSSNYPVLENMWQPGTIEAAHFGDGWSLLMDPRVPTCRSLDQPLAGLTDAQKDPSQFQYYMIDGFVVSDNIKVDRLETQDLGFRNSDHDPVVLDVELK